MSWATSSIEAIAQYGWGAVVLSGLGATALLMLSVTASLALWRYFHPLARVDSPERSSEQSAPDPIPDRIALAERDLLYLFEFATTQTTISFLNELYESMPQTGDPLQIEEADFREKNEAGQKYLRQVGSRLGDTIRGSNFREVMQQAATDAEYEIKKIRPEQRPANIDPLDFRTYAITMLQCGRIRVFLWREKREMESQLIGFRSNLIDRLKSRNQA